jgi:hypothetical protein
MDVPERLTPLLNQFDFGCERLVHRMQGPLLNSGNGVDIPVPVMTDDEYFWSPVPNSWTLRRQADGPSPGATRLYGAGEWGLDAAAEHPYPPPFTTIAWRLGHLTEMLTLRTDYTVGARAMGRYEYEYSGSAAGAIAAFETASAGWRSVLTSVDDAALSQYNYCTLGSDGTEPFIEIVWWVNQEVLAHAAEIALLRDLYREQHRVNSA